MGVTLLQGDCLEVMRTLADGSVDAVITDPPYSSGTRKEAAKGLRKTMIRSMDDAEWFGTDSLTASGFGWLMHACAVQWHRLLKPGGHILCFIDWRMLPFLAGAIESGDLRYTNLIVWDKTYFGMGQYFRNQHEMIVHFTKGSGVPAQRHDTANVLQFKPIRSGVHPTEKPVDLLSRLITTVCPVGGTVLDPFAGSGSTGVACLQEGRDFVGVEKSPTYHAIAEKRLVAAQPPLPLGAVAD